MTPERVNFLKKVLKPKLKDIIDTVEKDNQDLMKELSINGLYEYIGFDTFDNDDEMFIITTSKRPLSVDNERLIRKLILENGGSKIISSARWASDI